MSCRNSSAFLTALPWLLSICSRMQMAIHEAQVLSSMSCSFPSFPLLTRVDSSPTKPPNRLSINSTAFNFPVPMSLSKYALPIPLRTPKRARRDLPPNLSPHQAQSRYILLYISTILTKYLFKIKIDNITWSGLFPDECISYTLPPIPYQFDSSNVRIFIIQIAFNCLKVVPSYPSLHEPYELGWNARSLTSRAHFNHPTVIVLFTRMQ